MKKHYDLVIVGGGILGTALAYWISSLYKGDIALLEMESDVAVHTSGRNTGVIHRPFYLNPERRKVFAKSAQLSYGLWKKFAALKGLPWQEIGTIEVACKPEEVKIIEKYMHWAIDNGMKEEEVEYLKPEAVRKLEPKVVCEAAIFAKTDTSVDYRLFTRALKADAAGQGVEFLFGSKLSRVERKGPVYKLTAQNGLSIEADFLINAAGGNAIDLAHQMGLGLEFTDLHFRGEYWEIAAEQAGWTQRNIYSVPRHPELPFLDPHWICRADGRREIGPNAVLISGPKTYEGFYSDPVELVAKILERPLINKFRLWVNPEFLKLASEEWVSSISKSQMVKRVRKFIPDLREEHLVKPGTAGIRSSVIDSAGNFMKEAIPLYGGNSFHILNYNSPGATGSPAYTALLVKELAHKGCLSHLAKKQQPAESFWNFQQVVDALN